MDNKIGKLLSHPAHVPAAVGVLVGFGSGLAVGYILAKREKKTVSAPSTEEQIALEKQLEDLRAKRAERNNKVVIHEDVVKQGKTFVEQVIEIDDQQDKDVELVRQSVFAQSDKEWDMEKEVANRDNLQVYTIHKDEFFEEKSGFKQRTFTYYNGDDVMVDEQEQPVYNYHVYVGDNLKFGHGSGDQNVVYIRNEEQSTEFEILRDSGLYSVEVLGLQIEENERARDRSVEHSAGRKFRPPEE